MLVQLNKVNGKDSVAPLWQKRQARLCCYRALAPLGLFVK
jgi:hypothetical protein